MSQTCPSCAAEASGRFCPQCGVAIDASCRACRNPLPTGARFCNQCGAAVAAQPAPTASAKQPVLAWAVAGMAVVALAGVTIIPRLTADPAQAAAALAPRGAAAASGAMDPTAVDLASMSPREAADRLFNRVMQAMANGDAGEVERFVPMAIQAYGMVPERNNDLHYHLGELYRAQGDFAAARAQSDTILGADPRHLLGLFSAAQTEQGRGNGDEAAALYQRFLDGYAEQMARNLPEYQEHIQGLPAMRAEAQKVVAPAQ